MKGALSAAQIATLGLLYLRDHAAEIGRLVRALVAALADQAERHLGVAMPGRTHLQHAQPVLLSHHLMAHAWPLVRDVSRLRDWDDRVAADSPYGSGALAGSQELDLGAFLGGAGLHQPDWERRTFEVSCWLRASAAYRGYGTEALDLLADLAFSRLGAQRIKLFADTRNGPTRRLADKCGYIFRGSVRDGYEARVLPRGRQARARAG